MGKSILGMDIGGTNLRSGFVDEQYRLTDFTITSSGRICGENAPAKLEKYIRDILHTTGRTPDAISIGFPSTLDKTRKKLLSTPNLDGFDNMDMVDYLENALKLPVFIDRDVNLLFLYDCHAHKLTGDIMIGCYIGTGLGNVVAIHGEILIGKNGVAAELGHIPMRGVKSKCSCGNVGCVEVIASGKALHEMQAKLYPSETIYEIFQNHADDEPVVTFINDLSLPISTEVNILDPDVVILGGGVIQMEGFPKERLENAIRFHARKPYPEKGLRICYSTEKQENGVIGAGIRALKSM